jgi:DNA-binding transcriptional regulator YhcF (GntR family)
MENYQSLQSNDIVAIESESQTVVKATERMKQILEAKYEQVDIKEVVAKCKHLSNTEQQQLFAVLNQFQSLFDGTLGHITPPPTQCEAISHTSISYS